MNGAKIYHSKFGTLKTIKLRPILFPRSSWPLRFNLTNYECVKNPVVRIAVWW